MRHREQQQQHTDTAAGLSFQIQSTILHGSCSPLTRMRHGRTSPISHPHSLVHLPTHHHSLIHPPNHPSLTHSLTHSLVHSLTDPPTLTNSLTSRQVAERFIAN